MKKRILRYLIHVFSTLLILALASAGILLSENAALHYADNPAKMNWQNDGPYIFYQPNGLLQACYIQGNQDVGFSVNNHSIPVDRAVQLKVHFVLDSTYFYFTLQPNSLKSPPIIYEDDAPIFAVSDIESSYKALRDLLISQRIIDKALNWTFGKGHLVLVGDMVDRGFSTTQVLWFIYRLEQLAAKQGGKVHYILGNHELKNLQGNFESTAPKFGIVAAILGKQIHQLYDENSFLGRWLASKNLVERINGHLFVHGGISPEVAQLNLSLDELNRLARRDYRNRYFPKPVQTDAQLLHSTHYGPAWYRGYCKDDDLSQLQVEEGLKRFGAKDVIVGHTLQPEVKPRFQGKVIAIDVRHPKDYHKNWPVPKSEGLLIEGNRYFRALVNGKREVLE